LGEKEIESEVMRNEMALLSVEELTTYFDHPNGRVQVVDGVSFRIQEGECFGIIGESGCGKSMTALSIMAYHTNVGACNGGGRIWFDGIDVLTLPSKELHEYRGKKVAIILQNPMSAINPLFSVGNQIEECIRKHRGVSGNEAKRAMTELFRFLGIPAERAREYPSQMSGGMLQRIAGGIAVGSHPRLIIADEPTTALDATIQLQYLQLLRKIQHEMRTAILFISHDIRVTALMCSRVGVMYAGQIVEEASMRELMEAPHHPYTEALLKAANPLVQKVERSHTIPGQPPFLLNPLPTCRFADRCTYCTEQCKHEPPPATWNENGRFVRCWRENGCAS
jgi:oligopeptide/dipeptide ABC transporter ATP-binding protein